MKKANLPNQSVSPFFEAIEKLTKGQRIAIYCVVFVLLIGCFVYFSYMPKYKQIGRLEKELEKLEKDLAKAKDNASKLKDYQEKMKQAQADFNRAKKKLPTEANINTLLASFSQAAPDAGLENVLFQPQNEVVKDFYAEIPIAIQLRGNYHNIVLFFDKITGLDRIVNVDNITISGPANKLDSGTLGIKCTAKTYRFVENPPKKQAPSKK
ncbi:MAG: type 4a pilus biogenesis protein PilO [Desulfobacterales bacterium]|nr:type 4a pilus biogenesis protein PilO [Desulfobacterales bacterium]